MAYTLDLTTMPDKTCADGSIYLKAEVAGQATGASPAPVTYAWQLDGGGLLVVDPGDNSRAIWRPENARAGTHRVSVTAMIGKESFTSTKEIQIYGSEQPQSPTVTPVALQRTQSAPTADLALWVVIRKATEALSFDNYSRFMDIVLCGADMPGTDPFGRTAQDFRNNFRQVARRTSLPYTDAEAYRLLKAATEAFVMVNCGVGLNGIQFNSFDVKMLSQRTGVSISTSDLEGFWLDYLADVNGMPNATLPYLALIRDKLRDSVLVGDIVGNAMNQAGAGSNFNSDNCYGIIRSKLTSPCLLELIWSYWHEEGMLVQTTNAIMRRFQNGASDEDTDPLRMMEIDPLRPLNNLLWGFIQDEQHRLSVIRRVNEYKHHYGLGMYGKAIPKMRTADNRSKFLEAFHNLLYLCSVFFKQDDDTTIIADGFPVLNALKEVHLLLSEGAHNQYGDMPSTARIEMLMQQWILARPEFREYLPTRTMVAYPERWMDRVDAMKTLKRWTDTPVLHFRDLGVFGEQILLSIRFGAWTAVVDPLQAANWARFWRDRIQGYMHAYRAATGVDLTTIAVEDKQREAIAAQPWVHLHSHPAMQVARRA